MRKNNAHKVPEIIYINMGSCNRPFSPPLLSSLLPLFSLFSSIPLSGFPFFPLSFSFSFSHCFSFCSFAFTFSFTFPFQSTPLPLSSSPTFSSYPLPSSPTSFLSLSFLPYLTLPFLLPFHHPSFPSPFLPLPLRANHPFPPPAPTSPLLFSSPTSFPLSPLPLPTQPCRGGE